MRSRLVWAAMLFTLLAAVAVAASLLVARVPHTAPTYGEARDRLTEAGFKIEAVRRGGKGRPLNAEPVVEKRPDAGSLYLRGLPVTLITAPEGQVIMPDLLGRFERDADQILDETGLQGTHEAFAGSAIVVSQEPSAGVSLPFGTRVTYRAIFPHQPSGTSTEVIAVHGLIYLRYGIEGTPQCSPCHASNTCSGKRCHSGGAFDHLERATPKPY